MYAHINTTNVIAGKYILQKAFKRKFLLVENFIMMFIAGTEFSIVQGWGSCSVVECLSHVHDSPGSIHSSAR